MERPPMPPLEQLHHTSEKTCPLCGASKPIGEYSFYYDNSRQRYRIQNYCQPCQKESCRRRALDYYQRNKEKCKQRARLYAHKNKEKVRTLARNCKRRYRRTLKDCYVRDQLRARGFTNEHMKSEPNITEIKRLQIQIGRKIKELKNGEK